MRALGPAVDIGESVAKDFEMIEQLVVKILLLQDSCDNCANFVFICVLTSFLQIILLNFEIK